MVTFVIKFVKKLIENDLIKCNVTLSGGLTKRVVQEKQGGHFSNFLLPYIVIFKKRSPLSINVENLAFSKKGNLFQLSTLSLLLS